MKCDELIEKIKQADDDYRHKFIPINLDIEIEDVLGAFAELKQKLEDAQREVNNYRRHANECEGLAAKGDIDKVSLLEEIKDIKNDKELLDSQLYGFLQLEEECGGGDLRNYIAELKAENRRLKRVLWLARAERAIEKIAWFKLWNASISTMNPEDGARQEYDKWKKNLGKFLKKAEENK